MFAFSQLHASGLPKHSLSLVRGSYRLPPPFVPGVSLLGFHVCFFLSTLVGVSTLLTHGSSSSYGSLNFLLLLLVFPSLVSMICSGGKKRLRGKCISQWSAGPGR